MHRRFPWNLRIRGLTLAARREPSEYWYMVRDEFSGICPHSDLHGPKPACVGNCAFIGPHRIDPRPGGAGGGAPCVVCLLRIFGRVGLPARGA